MNLRNVLRAYSLLRTLSDDESALLETLRAANDNERQLIAEAMADKPQKKSSKKSAGKSRRASSLQSQMSSALKPLIDVINQPRCAKCDNVADDNAHHKQTDPNYHDFQPAEQAAGASGD